MEDLLMLYFVSKRGKTSDAVEFYFMPGKNAEIE